jgi:CheY-like chemotaxis protein
MDCRMPGMDGIEAAREIRKIEGAECHVPIIAITADVLDEVRIRCLQAGMDAFVTKPVKPEELEITLARWLKDGEQGLASIRDELDALSEREEDLLDKKVFESVQAVLNQSSDVAGANIVSVFLQDAESRIDQLRQMLTRKDLRGIAQCANGLKGTAGDVGALRVMQISKKIGRNASVERQDTLPLLVDRLELEFSRTKDLMKSRVA